MRLWHVTGLLGVLFLAGSCRSGPIFDRADDSVREAKQQIDDSVERAAEKVERLVAESKVAIDDSLKGARAEYKGALQDTTAEVDKLREDLKRDLAELDRRSQERIEQIRSSSLELIRAGDQAAQARIDQVFTELRQFMADTLERITRLIQPVLTMADKISGVAETSNRAVQEILVRLTGILDEVKNTIGEVRKAIQQVRGVNPETGETTGGILGWLSMALTGLLAAWRKFDSSKNGDRWKRDELEDNTRTDVEKHLKAGTFDDEIAGRIAAGAFDAHLQARLVSLGVLRVSAPATVPSREGGDPSSPQGTSGPPSVQ